VIVDIGNTGNGGSPDSATGRWPHGTMVSADTDANGIFPAAGQAAPPVPAWMPCPWLQLRCHAPIRRSCRAAAWLVVLLVHGGLALWLLDSGRIELRSGEGPRISLHWLPPEPPAPVPQQPALPSAKMTRPAASMMPRPAPVAQAESALPAPGTWLQWRH
jgi:hypothetical protein